MKKLLFLSTAIISLYANNLLDIKNELYQYDIDIAEQNSKAMKWDVIDPFYLSWDKTNNNISDIDSQTSKIGISQHISLGTYYAVQYANQTNKTTNIQIQINKQNDILNTYTLALNIKKLDLLIQKQKLLLDNSKINIIQKRDIYDDGKIDISFLNDAIIQKNKIKLSLVDLHSQKHNLINQLKQLSNTQYQDISLPVLSDIDFDTYIADDLIYKLNHSLLQSLKNAKNIRLSQNLPAINLSANYNKTTINNQNTEGMIYNIGAKMPLVDMALIKTYQSSKISYIKQKLMLKKLYADLKLSFDNQIFSIKQTKTKIQITDQNTKVYDSLLNDTKERFELGEATSYDVQLIQNSQHISKLEQNILQLDKDLILLQINKWRIK